MPGIICPSCGLENQIGSNFCSSCGTDLRHDDITSETPAISVDNDLDAIDRSAFGPHEGLFVVVQGSKSGARYALDTDTVTLGRHPESDIFLDDITVSSRIDQHDAHLNVFVSAVGASSVLITLRDAEGALVTRRRRRRRR